jgi:low molecular weight protein-tyrosine phosphatase
MDHMVELPYRVTFVCTGNICRSPMAEVIFRARAAEQDLEVVADSSGIGPWHVGEPADERTVATLRRAGYRSAHLARQFEPDWFERYDLIVALDAGHLAELRHMAPDGAAAKIRLLREFDPAADELDVPDPYYGDDAGFTEVLEIIEAAIPGLLDEVRAALKDRT